ncbi:MAG: NIL domain-containing protein [Candidatus Saelkia tenebricola]|nr:NIL domain-containing protein [Candidatus Saelkia tenebricola]
MESKKIVLHFPRSLVDKPIICKLIREFDLDFNILKASVTPNEEGLLVLELIGEDKDLKKAVEYLKSNGVTVQSLSKDIIRNDKKCTHCGVCVVYCPTGALFVDNETQEVLFQEDKCIGCEICVNICPLRAMEVHF